MLLALASCAGTGGAARPGNLYTPVREGQASGPLPPEPVPYYPYEPRKIQTWQEVPAEVRARAEAHVRERVGADFYRRLRFVGGQFVDVTELHRVNPASRQFRMEPPAYLLRFEFALGLAGIRRYVASVGLRQDGSLSEELNLPAFAANPAKLALRPLAEVRDEAIRQRLIDPAMATATVAYDRTRDEFLWHFEQPLPGDGPEVRVRTVEMNAHTGALVRNTVR